MGKSIKRQTFELRASRLNAIKKLKKELKAKFNRSCKKTAIHFSNKCENHIKEILRHRMPEDFCSHFLVGASSVHAFLRGKHSVESAHSVQKTNPDNRITGDAGEAAFKALKYDIAHNHPFSIHKKVPFVCATGDFIINEQGTKIAIEVKTFSDKNAAFNFYKHVPDRTILQLWIQLEVFGLQKGIIYIYHLDRISKIVNLIGKIYATREVGLFDNYFSTLAAIQYANFLQKYYQMHSLYPSELYFEDLSQRLAHNLIRHCQDGNHSTAKSFDWQKNRSLSLNCPFYENLSEAGPNLITKFETHRNMFNDHRFIQTSKQVSFMALNVELRTKILQTILSNLGNKMKTKILTTLAHCVQRSRKNLLTGTGKKNIRPKNAFEILKQENQKLKVRLHECQLELSKVQQKASRLAQRKKITKRKSKASQQTEQNFSVPLELKQVTNATKSLGLESVTRDTNQELRVSRSTLSRLK